MTGGKLRRGAWTRGDTFSEDDTLMELHALSTCRIAATCSTPLFPHGITA